MPKILIVDDEARILLLLQSLLKANGYDVVTAKDGNGALDAIKSDPPASGQRNAGRWLAGARFLQVLNWVQFGIREGFWQG